jgi:hypothetical protein
MGGRHNLNHQKNDLSWHAAQTLKDMADHLYLLSKSKQGEPSPGILVVFAKRLISAEEKPGGPYRDEAGEISSSLNYAIARLFHAWGKPLPALSDYLSIAQESHVRTKNTVDDREQRLYARRHNELVKSLGAEDDVARYHWLKEDGEQVIDSIVRLDKKRYEISGIVYDWVKILGCGIDEHQLFQLARANMALWIAYTLYDHIIDEESDSIDYLSIANVYHRRSYDLYLDASDTLRQKKLVSEVFTRMDEANHRERKYLRLPVDAGKIKLSQDIPRVNKKFVAERAAGHTLGPLLLIEKYEKDAQKKRYWKSILTHYLFLRQYCDDIHDWRDDLAKGHVTTCTALLLKGIALPPGAHSLVGMQERCQGIFWQKIFQNTSSTYLKDIDILEKRLNALTHSAVGASLFLGRAIAPLRQTLEVGLRVVSEQKEFIGLYRD